MLQANPSLTPNLVKALLTYTAQPLSGFNMFEQGAGQINIQGAVDLARLVRTDLTVATPLGDQLLTTNDLPAPETTIAGHTFTWSRGIILNHTYATGSISYKVSKSRHRPLGDVSITGDGVITCDRQ